MTLSLARDRDTLFPDMDDYNSETSTEWNLDFGVQQKRSALCSMHAIVLFC